MGMFGKNGGLDKIIGAKIYDIKFDEDNGRMSIETNRGTYLYEVAGDWCSHSYFADKVGVEKAIANGAVKSVGELEIIPTDLVPKYSDNDRTSRYGDDYIQVYGFEIVTTHPKWGDQTTVITFRNASNGYYGGWMYSVNDPYIDSTVVQGEIEK